VALVWALFFLAWSLVAAIEPRRDGFAVGGSVLALSGGLTLWWGRDMFGSADGCDDTAPFDLRHGLTVNVWAFGLSTTFGGFLMLFAAVR
jgi:hypothetical protein